MVLRKTDDIELVFLGYSLNEKSITLVKNTKIKALFTFVNVQIYFNFL